MGWLPQGYPRYGGVIVLEGNKKRRSSKRGRVRKERKRSSWWLHAYREV